MFRHLNIRNKLAIVLWSSALLAFALAAAAIALHEHLTAKNRAHRFMEPYAQLVSVGADAAVAFEDPVRAQEILNTLRANPHITEAAITLDNGRLLAGYTLAAPAGPHAPPPPLRPDGIYLHNGTATLVESLPHGGHLALTMSLEQFGRPTRQTLWIIAAAVLVLLAITLGQLAVLQRTLVHPLGNLVKAAERARTDGDYTPHHPATTGTDEVAQLARSFDAMMATVREREDDLRRLTLFQRTLLDNAAHGIISSAPTGLVSSINPAATRLLGYTPAETLGKLTPLCWHEPAEIARRARQLTLELGETVPPDFSVFTALARRNLPDESEWTLLRKNGTRFPALVSATAMRDDHGHITGFVCLINDLSSRKRTEQMLRESQALYHSFVEQLPNAVFRKDRDNRYVMVNTQFCRLKGLKAAEFLGRTPLEVAAKQAETQGAHGQATKYAAEGEDIHHLIMRTGQIIEREEEYSGTNGHKQYFNVIRMPVFDSAGTIVGTQGILFDITERKQIEKQYLHSQRVEAVGTLASGVAHDLNNILTPIIMASDLLASSLPSKDDREILAMIKGGAQRGADIIRQLLMFSRGVDGARTTVQPAQLLKEMRLIMRETFPRNINISEDTPHDPDPVIADPTQLHQVLMNLCVNARDAMPDGGTLILSARNTHLDETAAKIDPHAKPGPYVILAVSDTGHGIPPEALPRIFDPFFTTKGVGKGSGLGLSTVLGIVKRHDGFVHVHTEPGRGTTFSVYLPSVHKDAASSLHPFPPAPGTPGGETLLVVDDEEPIRTLLRRILEQQHHRVHTADNGRAALEIYEKHRAEIRLVITDIMMPVMDGITLIRSLKTLAPDLPVLATSGLDDGVNREQLRALGIPEILTKPFERETLLEAVHRQMNPVL